MAPGLDRRSTDTEKCGAGLAHFFPRRIPNASKQEQEGVVEVRKAMHERKKGTLKSGRSGKKVKSRKQAIAIGLSEARKAGAKVPKKKSTRTRAARKKAK